MRVLLVCLLSVLLLGPAPSRAESGMEILHRSRQALAALVSHADPASTLLEQAPGVLVFPDMVKLGFSAAGQFGEGVLLVAGEPVAYYVNAGVTHGLRSEAKYKSEVILFLTEDSLQRFRSSRGWEVGVDAPVTILNHAAPSSLVPPVVGYIFSNEGLLAGMNLHGSRIVRVTR